LNAFAAVIVILFTIGIATRDKKFFEVETDKDFDGNDAVEEVGSDLPILIAFSAAVFPYGIYWFLYWGSNPKWEYPLLSTIVFIVLILIGTPIGCAIAKCKED